jgi:hypothetical protein
MARRSDQRSPHQGRTTVSSSDDLTLRPRSKVVVATAWLLVGGLTLAVVLPVLALLFG